MDMSIHLHGERGGGGHMDMGKEFHGYIRLGKLVILVHMHGYNGTG